MVNRTQPGLKTPPRSYEWEFGRVPQEERGWCALWEYARSSPDTWVEAAVQEWFDTRLGGWTTRDRYCAPRPNAKTVLDVLRQGNRTREDNCEVLDARPSSLKWGKQTPPREMVELPESYHFQSFCRLVMELPKFPKPWLKIKSTERQAALMRLASVRLAPFGTIPSFRIQEFHEGAEAVHFAEAVMKGLDYDWPEDGPWHHYVMTIDWDQCGHDQAVKNFRKWLTENPHRRDLTGGRHKKTPIPNELLRNLAAMRWAAERFTFAEAHESIIALEIRDSDLLPNRVYPKKGKATDAASDLWWHRRETAKKTVQALFPVPRR